MDKKSKIFLLVFFGLIIAVIGISFYKYFVAKNYFIKAETACDPATEKCFAYTCDPEEDAECPEDEAERVSYYKYVEKKAFKINQCDAATQDCNNPICEPGEDCKVILCDESTVSEGEECNDPAKYKEELDKNNLIDSEADAPDSENAEETPNNQEN